MLMIAAAATGCEAASSEKEPRAPTAAAEEIGDLPNVTRTVELPRMLDQGHLPGAPTDYDAGWLFHDDRLGCTAQERSVSCGAVLEVWGNDDHAKARSEYLKALINSMPQQFGIERHYREGRLLLRVTGKVADGVAAEYAATLRG
jgi:hypothetical protein